MSELFDEVTPPPPAAFDDVFDDNEVLFALLSSFLSLFDVEDREEEFCELFELFGESLNCVVVC